VRQLLGQGRRHHQLTLRSTRQTRCRSLDEKVRRLLLPLFAALALAGILVAPTLGGATPQRLGPLHTLCSAGYVDAVIGGAPKCLRAGEFCSPGAESDYERYGFACVDGHLKAGAPTTTSSTTSATVNVGQTVKLAKRTQTSGCTRGVLPDRQCSPGADYSGLTKAVLCSSTFRTSSIRNVPDSAKHQVEIEYGMTPKSYGRTIEIDHIVSLELGGSNDLANLYPEPGSGSASYRVKDKLENKLHGLVCAGSITLHAAQAGIARNWETLYRTVYGTRP
jgi:hypothetical protein